MRASLAAARFLFASARPGGWRTGTRTPTELRLGDERLRAWRYTPSRPRWTVLALHGLTLRGADDPRMDAVCHALAFAGCTVLAPELPDTARLRVGSADVERIAGLLTAPGGLHSRGDPGADRGAIGIFAPSFSAAMALRAAAQTATQVTAVCAVGACGSVSETVRHLLEAPGADPYGRLVLFRNFGPPALGWRGALCEALDAWLADDSLRRTAPAFPAARAALSDGDGALVDDLLRGGWHARALAPLLLAQAAPVLRALDVRPVAADVRAQVTLLHGTDDAVIPFTESVALAGWLPDAHLCVTRLLTHGDTRLDAAVLPQVARLHAAMTAWFAGLGRAA
jgi:pimeloyl-ACP methyl ester carboxylesterase